MKDATLCSRRLLTFLLLTTAQRPIKGLSTLSSWSVNDKQRVAVIGGGVAGLSCANSLADSGKFIPTVFDTGRLRPGGRCASRLPEDIRKQSDPHHYDILSRAIIDHAAQIVTVPPGCPEFAKQVDEWKDEGILKRFPEKSVCDIINPFDRETKQYDKSRVRLKPMAGDLYYAVNGMQAIPNAMRGNFAIEQDVWVSPNDGVRLVNRDGGKQWEIKAKGDVLGHFDKLVIAHNGKCADRLMSTTPAKDFHRLLQVNFAPYVPRDGGKRMTLNSLYSLSFAMPLDSVLSNTLPSKTFTCGFIKNHPNLRFISCNSRKHPLEAIQDVEVWTVLSSAKFGKAHKGPQENLPTELVNEVTGLMYDSIEEALALPKGSVRGPPDNAPGKGRVMESLLQLWGAAVPVNTWVSTDGADGFIYDAEYGVGACGDWLLDASVAGAWESGRRLAKFMIHGGQETMGLSGGFKASAAVDKIGIGAFQ